MRIDYYVKVVIPPNVTLTPQLESIAGHIGRIEEIQQHPQAGEMVRLHNLDGWVQSALVEELRHIEESEWNRPKTTAIVKAEKEEKNED